MKIIAKKPVEAFDFNQAVGAVFQTPGGKDYALRLWFWLAMTLFIVLIVSLPLILPHMGALMEASWTVNQATFNGQEPEVEPLWEALINLIPGYIIILLGLLTATSLGEAAFYRKYLLGAEPAKMPLRFDRHMVRNLIVQIGFYVLFFLLYFAGVLIVAVIGGGVAGISPVLGGFLIVIGFIALIAALIGYPVKYAPAAALSHLNDSTHLLAARKVTKHRFWSLFGAYVVTYIGGYIAYYILYILVLGVVTGDMDFIMSMSGLSTESPASAFQAAAERISNPLVMIIGVLGVAVISAAWSAWMLWIAGVSAYAVKWWANDVVSDPTNG